MKRLSCPKCKLKMEVFKQIGVEIDQCGNCGGVWLDADEWTDLTRGRGADAVTFEVVNRQETEFKCPRCPSAFLEVGFHSEDSTFEIEYCARCKGGFFDRGEMVRLLARPDSNKS